MVQLLERIEKNVAASKAFFSCFSFLPVFRHRACVKIYFKADVSVAFFKKTSDATLDWNNFVSTFI